MEVVVHIYGTIKDLIPESKIQVFLPSDATVEDLMNMLVEKYGKRLKERLVTSEGRLQPGVRMVIGNDSIDHRHKMKERRLDQPEIDLYVMQITAGG